jgi:hypothetical protein
MKPKKKFGASEDELAAEGLGTIDVIKRCIMQMHRPTTHAWLMYPKYHLCVCEIKPARTEK